MGFEIPEKVSMYYTKFVRVILVIYLGRFINLFLRQFVLRNDLLTLSRFAGCRYHDALRLPTTKSLADELFEFESDIG